MEKEINNSILHDWVVKLDLKHQANLLPVLRGCDTEHKELKKVTKMLRWIIGKNFIKNTNYSDDNIMDIKNLSKVIEYYGRIESKHWYNHIMLAIKTIVDKHPDPYIRKYWSDVLTTINGLTKISDRIYRLLKEKNDLSSKVSKLSKWIENHRDKVTEEQEEQLFHMKKYLAIVTGNIMEYCEDEILIYSSGEITLFYNEKGNIS